MIEYNECQPITIFPLGIACQTTNPTSATTSDGVASLIVTGGIPPYNILWDNGNTTFTITNLSVGSYPVTVTDYYGDFTANTTCKLTASAQTTTTTTSTTPQPTYELCMVISYLNQNGSTTTDSIHFTPNGLSGGYQSWISDDDNYTITWNVNDNVWQLNNYGQTVLSTNPAYPPLNNWKILGKKGDVTVTQGECQNVENLSLNVSSNPTTCTSCDGSINLVGAGGVPPYQYSIDGGLTWSSNSVFQELCPDVTYSVKVKDSTDTIFTPPVNNTILFPSVPITTYSVTINSQSVNLSSTSIQTTTTISVFPSLPAGVTLNFDLQLQGLFTRTPYINSASGSFTTTVIKNGTPITTYVNNSYDNVGSYNSYPCSSYLTYNTYYVHTYESLTYQTNDVYSITTVISYTKTCNNPPPPVGISEFEITPEPTPTPVFDGDNEEYNGGPGPLKYGATSTGISPCCQATILFYNGFTNNVSLSGCQCCNVQGVGSLYE